MPWLSVIMPTFNGAAFLASALESICAQRDDDIEVIIVDDGSSDETLEIARSYANGATIQGATAPSRPATLDLKIVSRPRRGNWVAGTNEGMALARGEYLCWLHQDDAWHPARLATLKAMLQHHAGADFLVHSASFIDAFGRPVGKWRCPLPAAERLAPEMVVSRLLVQDFLASSATLFKASAARRAGTLDERLWFLADWDYWLRLAANGETVCHHAPLTSFRLHRGSQTMTRAHDLAWQYEVVHQRHLPRWEGHLPDYEIVARTSRFSAAVNMALARWALGERRHVWSLPMRFARLGPGAWHRYLRDSRIIERIVSRIRARVLPLQAPLAWSPVVDPQVIGD